MTVDATDRALLAALEAGLALVEQHFAALAQQTGLTEQEVIDRLRRLKSTNVIKRFGVIVRHRELGYRANAMVVWDIPDDQVSAVARILAALPFVTLCYRRPRLPGWPYNLFCMIHGKDRGSVYAQIERANAHAGTADLPQAVLFSSRAFKQHGARYAAVQALEPA